MHKTAQTWQDVAALWAGPRNFRLADSLAGFGFRFPPLEQVIDEMRADEEARIMTGASPDTLGLDQAAADAFRKEPIDTVMDLPFALAHFDIGRFDGPGGFLDGFGARVLEPWQRTLADNGFTWERCYPIIFISGKGCVTRYHMDFSHVIAWQIYGTKRFCGLKEPDRWADKAARLNYKPGQLEKPDAIREEDSLCYDMRPGDKLWNVILTPHWVEAGEEPAMSINISHGGLRREGRLAPNEDQLEEFRRLFPDTAPEKMQRVYRSAAVR